MGGRAGVTKKYIYGALPIILVVHMGEGLPNKDAEKTL